jgi:hypothetical protein
MPVAAVEPCAAAPDAVTPGAVAALDARGGAL